MPSLLRKMYPILFVTLVVFVSVILLAFTESFTSAELQARLQQQVEEELGSIFPDLEDSEYDEESEVYTLLSGGATVGYAFIAVGVGYGGNITILVGLEDAEKLKGVVILSHLETPGIGDRIENDDFLNQFVGLNINDALLREDGGQIDALSAATISSRAVVDAVRKTAMEKVGQLEGAE